MIGRLIGAVARAVLVVLMISTPSLLLPGVSTDTTQIVALVAIFAAALTIFEYCATYPGLVEFRDAPPFNRVRFMAMFATVFLLTVIAKGQLAPTHTTTFVHLLGSVIGYAIDFPYSPVRLVVAMLPEGASAAQVDLVRAAAGLAYLTSLLSLAIFAVLIRVKQWPVGNGSFNVWVNLPTFDPTAGGDVVQRLSRDARMNVALGLLLPFFIPALVRGASAVFEPANVQNYQTLIWTVTAWAFLPASLFMRGIALGRIAGMIRQQRRRAANTEEGALLPA